MLTRTRFAPGKRGRSPPHEEACASASKAMAAKVFWTGPGRDLWVMTSNVPSGSHLSSESPPDADEGLVCKRWCSRSARTRFGCRDAEDPWKAISAWLHDG